MVLDFEYLLMCGWLFCFSVISYKSLLTISQCFLMFVFLNLCANIYPVSFFSLAFYISLQGFIGIAIPIFFLSWFFYLSFVRRVALLVS